MLTVKLSTEEHGSMSLKRLYLLIYLNEREKDLASINQYRDQLRIFKAINNIIITGFHKT